MWWKINTATQWTTSMEWIILQNLDWQTFHSYIHFLGGVVEYRPLLEDNQRFPDSSFNASASSEGHNASDARISSGSSWCAPVSDDKHYLQVDLGRVYRVYYLITYGDSTSLKWVATYELDYSIDLVNWNYYTVRMNDIINNNIKQLLDRGQCHKPMFLSEAERNIKRDNWYCICVFSRAGGEAIFRFINQQAHAGP
jgi:hypothetical protein